MQQIGLMPSDTGMPGGKVTGEKMSDYPIKGGIFEKAYDAMSKDLMLPFKSSEPLGELDFLNAAFGELNIGEILAPIPTNTNPKRNKTKYTCLICKTNVWGKPEIEIICRPCFEFALDSRPFTAPSSSFIDEFLMLPQN